MEPASAPAEQLEDPSWVNPALHLWCLLMLAVAEIAHTQRGPERQFLIQEDLEIPGYEILLTEASLAVGQREGRHTHPGTLVGRVHEGELTLEREGQPTIVLKPGDSVLVPPGQVHEGINTGSVPFKALVTLVVEKGSPCRRRLRSANRTLSFTAPQTSPIIPWSAGSRVRLSIGPS